MQKKIKVVFASLLCACVASTIGMTACGKDGITPKIGDNGNWFIGDTDTGVKAEGNSGKSAYQVWLDAGNTGTEQDFLDSLKGTPGQPGTPGEAPEITVGENGNWFVNGVDTNHKAQGENGKSAYELWLEQEGNAGKSEEDFFASLKGDDGVSPEIKDGYWWIGDTNTNVKAEGINGVTPEIKDGYWWIGDTNTNVKAEGTNGARGNKITHSEGAPTSTEGAIEGDMYVDTKEWNVYFFESGKWENYGSIKGADGTGGGTAEESTIKINIDSRGYDEIDVPAGTAQGVHIIEADLGSTQLSTGRLQMHINGKDDTSELVYSESRSQVQHNVYFGYINIAEGDAKITFQTTNSVTVNADITVKDYEMPTLKADGQPVEIPVNLNSASSIDLAVYKFKVDLASVQPGAYHWTLSTTVASEVLGANIKLWFGGSKGILFASMDYSNGADINIDQTKHLEGCNGEAYFQIMDATDKYNLIYPVTITLTAASS